MPEPSSEISSFCNTNPRPSNNYNPSAGNFEPYLTEELENMIKTLKIDSASHKLLNGYPDNTLVAVIDCLIYLHYNSKDIELLKNFFFDFNQKLCENPLEKEELEDLWVQQTALIQYNIDDDNHFFNKPEYLTQEYIQQSDSDLPKLELAEEIVIGEI